MIKIQRKVHRVLYGEDPPVLIVDLPLDRTTKQGRREAQEARRSGRVRQIWLADDGTYWGVGRTRRAAVKDLRRTQRAAAGA